MAGALSRRTSSLLRRSLHEACAYEQRRAIINTFLAVGHGVAEPAEHKRHQVTLARHRAVQGLAEPARR
jgi:hypothetical protein